MGTNRFMFSLGDGIDSITGAHKGCGIIIPQASNTHDKPILSEKASLIKKFVDTQSTPIQSGDTHYEVSIVSDYSDLSQALDLKAYLTTSISQNNVSYESELFKKAKLCKQNVTLLIKGKKIGFVQTLPPDTKASEECMDHLIHRRSTFVEAYGDKYVSQVMYGKVIYALINFVNTNQEEAIQIKQTLEAKLASHINLSAPASYTSSTTKKHTLTDISLEYSGVELGLPGVASSIEDLFAFIDQFNKAELIGTPIGFVSQPYVTLIHMRESAELSKQMDMIQSLLSEFDKIYNRNRILIPSIEKLVYGVRYFYLEDSISKYDIHRLQEFLDTSHKFKRIMEDLMLEISLNKTDLTCLPEKLTDHITLDIPAPLSNQENLDDDKKSSNAHHRQYYVRSQLNTILKLCTESISNMESEIDIISRQLCAEVVRITPTDDHVHLNLPPGGSVIQWTIFSDNIHSFSLKVKDTKKCISSYATIYERIASGMEEKLNITPSQRLKITPHGKGEYVIVGSIVGLQALDPSIPRHATSWKSKEWQSTKAKEPSKTGAIIEFNGKSSLATMSVPWLEHNPSFFSSTVKQDTPDNNLIDNVNIPSQSL